MSTPSERTFILAQKISTGTSSLSCVSSAAVASMIIVVAKDRGCTPYHRIIFGLSISDVLQSAALFAGSFASPSDTPGALWSRGDIHTCNAVGVFLSIGSLMIPMYTFALCFYFLLRVKHRITPDEFARKFEWKAHVFFILWNVIGAMFILFTKGYNAGRYGSVCSARGYPLYCDHDPVKYGDCTRGANARRISMITRFIPALLCFVGMFICLGKTTRYVYIQEKRLHSQSRQRVVLQATNEGRRMPQDHATRISSNHCPKRPADLFCSCIPKYRRASNVVSVSEISRESDQPRDLRPSRQMQRRRRSYMSETLIQSALYLLSCLATYFTVFLFVFTEVVGIVPGKWVSICNAIFYPLGGLFNILVYTRPKVAILRDRSPDSFWIILFFRVIIAGADVPDEVIEDSPLRGAGLVSPLRNTSEVYDIDSDAVVVGTSLSSFGLGNTTIASMGLTMNEADNEKNASEDEVGMRKLDSRRRFDSSGHENPNDEKERDVQDSVENSQVSNSSAMNDIGQSCDEEKRT